MTRWCLRPRALTHWAPTAYAIGVGRPRKDAFDEATEVRVLRAAEEIFGERGFRAARLEDIAAAAGIRRPSLLYHFKTKGDLYAAVVKRAFDEMTMAVAGSMKVEGSFEERLAAVVNGLMSFEAEHRPLVRVIFRELIDPDGSARDAVGAQFVPLVDMLTVFVEQQGVGSVPEGLPIRPAIMQLIMGHLARASMDELGERLWGGESETVKLSRALLLSHCA